MRPLTDNARVTGAAVARTALLPFALIVTLFFLWGMANNLNDILITQFKKAFTLSDFQAGLVQSAFYLGYFLLALPAGVFMRKYGYKGAIIVGLVLYGIGALLFWPAAQVHTYGLFLLALFVIASGLAFLETSANPFVTVLGPKESAAGRLNLAQAFNPLGSITGVVIGQHFIFSGVEHTSAQLASMTVAARDAYFLTESRAVQVPYLIIGIVVLAWALLIAMTRFQTQQTNEEHYAIGGQLGRLVRHQRFVFAVVAQFFYVGAQVGIWSYLIRYTQATVPGTSAKAAANFLTISLVVFMIGRFASAALMRYFTPSRLLATFAALNLVFCGVAIAFPGQTGIYALVVSSFFMSLMFPTIFALGLDGLSDDERKLGSALVVMAIIGGAILTAAMGAISDAAGIHIAMVVPLFCFAVILAFALQARTAATDSAAS